MFALCDRMDKEGIYWTYSSPKQSPGREEERGYMIGQNPKAEVALFYVSGNRDKEISLGDRSRHERTRDLMPNSGWRSDIKLLDKMTDAFKPSYIYIYIKPR